MTKKEVILRKDEEYIELKSLLKLVGVISTGGMAKAYLSNNKILVDGKEENRRGRKIYRGSNVIVADLEIKIK